MPARDLESHLEEEAAPLLNAVTNGHDELFEDDTPPKDPVPVSHVVFTVGFSGSLGLALASLGLNITQTIFDAYGRSRFEFDDWDMRAFRLAIFWASSISIVASIANLIHLARSRKPLTTFINFLLTTALTITLLYYVGALAKDRGDSPPSYCKPSLKWPGYPEDPYPDPNSPLMDPETMRKCREWAPKIEIITQVLVLVAAIHGVVMTGLFIAVLINIYRYRSVIWESMGWPKIFRSGIGRGHFAVEFSFHWGAPEETSPVQPQVRQGQTLIDHE